jgi:hypothetical protein
MILVQLVCSNGTRPMDHEDHHTNPRANFSLFFTFWDDLMGCSQHKRGRYTWPLWAPNLAFYFLLTVYYEWVLWGSPHTFALALAVHAFTPLSAVIYALLGGRVSRAVTRLPYWDTLRREYLVGYAAPGQAGAFKADPSKRYVFCYQPMGIQARGAWYTFAGRGRGSPVSGLADCKLAVGRVLWSLPLAQPFFALFGCCDSSYRTLKGLLSQQVRARGGGGRKRGRLRAAERLAAAPWRLTHPHSLCACTHTPSPRPLPFTHPPTCQTPKSVCITVGGFREAKYAGTYNVAAKCRRGFARLALETGAALVPVVGVGEPFVCSKPAWGARVLKILSA